MTSLKPKFNFSWGLASSSWTKTTPTLRRDDPAVSFLLPSLLSSVQTYTTCLSPYFYTLYQRLLLVIRSEEWTCVSYYFIPILCWDQGFRSTRPAFPRPFNQFCYINSLRRSLLLMYSLWRFPQFPFVVPFKSIIWRRASTACRDPQTCSRKDETTPIIGK